MYCSGLVAIGIVLKDVSIVSDRSACLKARDECQSLQKVMPIFCIGIKISVKLASVRRHSSSVAVAVLITLIRRKTEVWINAQRKKVSLTKQGMTVGITQIAAECI